MQLVSMKNISVSFTDSVLFSFENLSISTGDRIGLVGANGSGKSTLLNVIQGKIMPDTGNVETNCLIEIFTQFTETTSEKNFSNSLSTINSKAKNEWDLIDLKDRSLEDLSGGEKGRFRLAALFQKPYDILLLDEPSSNLDFAARDLLIESLLNIETFVLISHDRDLLNKVTNRTIEIREQKIFDYPAPYSEYKEWLVKDIQRREQEYELYQKEKKRLQNVMTDQKRRAQKTQRKPKGLSSSERKARAFGAVGKSIGGKAKSIEASARNTAKRIEHLEVKERPQHIQNIRPDFRLTDPPQNRIIIEAKGVHFSYPNCAPLFHDLSFNLRRNAKVALVGKNGSGKTTLLNLIANGYEGIRVVPKANIGYFKQNLSDIDYEKTVLDNMRVVSCQKEQIIRNILVRMGFGKDRVNQKVETLSGGERIKLSLAMLFVSSANVLVLDEVTNFLDLPSLEAIESLLQDYEGTLIFVSHDSNFLYNIADEIWELEDGQLHSIDFEVY